MNTYIGIDLGGTKIAGILVDSKHDTISEVTMGTDNRDETAVIDCVRSVIDRLSTEKTCSSNHLTGIGIGIAGHVDFEKGTVIYCPNLPIENLNLKAILQKAYNIPVFIENDANAAAIGEKYFGQAAENGNFVCVTLGTGIGAGIFINGKLYRGSTCGAGELGHMILDFSLDAPVCGCGNRGCFEALVSGTAIARMAETVFSKKNITAYDVAKMAQTGNLQAIEIFNHAARIIGIGFANIVNLFNPEKIIVSGSLAQAEDLFLKQAIKIMMKRTFSTNAKSVAVVKSSLGNRGGVLGAAALAIQHCNR
ncbi:MAG: ROK family protein [Pseudomonadota bacterium]